MKPIPATNHLCQGHKRQSRTQNRQRGSVSPFHHSHSAQGRGDEGQSDDLVTLWVTPQWPGVGHFSRGRAGSPGAAWGCEKGRGRAAAARGGPEAAPIGGAGSPGTGARSRPAPSAPPKSRPWSGRRFPRVVSHG